MNSTAQTRHISGGSTSSSSYRGSDAHKEKKKKGRRSFKDQGRSDRNRLSHDHRDTLKKHHSMDSTDVHPSGSNSDGSSS
mmetsp:Transcript_59120/g.116012  ORF Transcript_59120/g.116012 Transcript_59120/m.116012 type:complete len:80 (+) Transcript_59120:248-487(+)